MPRTAVLSKDNQTNGSIIEPDSSEPNGNNGSEKKRSNPFMYGLTPEMIEEPYPLDFADGMDSYEFALEKFRRLICVPLKFKSQKELLDFAKAEWQWIETASDRETKTQAEQMIDKVKNWIAETQDNPKLNQLIKDRLAELVDS